MIGITMTGWDGSVWDLRTGPVRITNKGLTGLGHLEFERFTQDTAMLHGQRQTGWRAKPRDVLLPVMMGPFLSEELQMRWTSAWWRLMHPEKANTLNITAPDGVVRHLRVKFVDDGGGPIDQDPTRIGLEVWPIRMIADDPWFFGDDFGKLFPIKGAPGSAEQDRNFYGGGAVVPGGKGRGTPLFVAKSRRSTSDIYTNPGDDTVWPVVTFTQRTGRFAITIGDGVVSADTQLVAAGQALKIEMSPLRKAATLIYANGTTKNITRQLKSFGFRPVPPETSTRIAIDVDTDGDYRVELIPHFFRGWGVPNR